MATTALKDKTILIVDDFAVNTELLSIFAADAGAKALTASNGKECLDIVKKQHVDLILMDRNMPVMDGIEATKAIRALPNGNSIVIVGTTGFSDGEETNACLRAGMDALYEKLLINDGTLIEIGDRFFGSKEKAWQRDPVEKKLLRTNESPQTATPMVMDYDKALHEFENDSVLLKRLMKDFNKITQSKLAAMRQALEKNDFNLIKREAHGIKGGAANLCAMPLSDAAKSLEMACRNPASQETIASLLEEMSEAAIIFDAFVRKMA